MKNYILIILSTILLSTGPVHAVECSFKEVSLSKTIYVVPVYKANAHFIFNDKDKEGFAQVTWGLDKAETKRCFIEGKEIYPQYSIIIPTVRMSELSLSVLWGLKSVPLNITQEANGHWSGIAQLIKIPHHKKKEIILATEQGVHVVSIHGDLRFRMTEIKREVVGNLQCTSKVEKAGVLNLYKRLSEINSDLDKRAPKEKIDKEMIMQKFLGTCVQFTNVESESLSEFNSSHRLNSKLIEGKVYFHGNVSKETSVSMPTIGTENTNVLDI